MIKKIYSNVDVIEMAKVRIKNIFESTNRVYLDISGGKDSIVLNDLVYKLCMAGEIDKNKLVVQFIDEEAIYPCVEEIVKRERKEWLMLGVQFEWYCIECKHFNCFNQLTLDETFICWDRTKSDVWIREKPSFAINYPPNFTPRKDSYQDFLKKNNKNGITITGVRCSESVQRLKYMAKSMTANRVKDKFMPIYDMADWDVWKYIYDNNLEIPKAYLYMYQVGRTKREMRISQFFSIDTMGSLVQVCEFYPHLFDRILKREPNVYLAMLYYDTEMFRRAKSKTKEAKEEDAKINYNAKVFELLNDDKFFTSKLAKDNRDGIYSMIRKESHVLTNEIYKLMYNCLVAGDPKSRTRRNILAKIHQQRYKDLMKEGLINE